MKISVTQHIKVLEAEEKKYAFVPFMIAVGILFYLSTFVLTLFSRMDAL